MSLTEQEEQIKQTNQLFMQQFPELNDMSIKLSKNIGLGEQMLMGEFLQQMRMQIIDTCLNKATVAAAIERRFVCGFSGPDSHSPQCRKCKLKKELGLM